MSFTYVLANSNGLVRLLLNDVDAASAVFSDEELGAFLTMEGGFVKLAAAQAIDTNADNEALALKVLRSQDLNTDGAKLADSLRARARELRRQHAETVDAADDGGSSIYIVDMVPTPAPELVEWLW